MAANSQEVNEDETKIQDTRVGETPSSNYFQIMNSYGKEFIFVVALVFTAIAALQDGPLKTKKANPPKLFFPPPSLVTDFYQGDLWNLMSLVLEKDVSFVMYYAPWDASCMQTREEFETVAKFYHHEIYFSAVNCWWPEGDCSKQFTISSYPALLAHIHEVGIVRYEGPLIASYMVSFLDYILSPLAPLQHTGDLLNLLVRHEGVLVAFFEFKDGTYPAGYHQFYKMAIKALTMDPHRRMCFAVITNTKVIAKFKMQRTIQLYTWNSTLMYEEPKIGTVEVLKWAYSHLKEVSQWVTPPGTKSRTLSQLIENSAALIMFTPRNLLLDSSPYYDLLREVALDYNNCNKSAEVTSLIHRIVLRRHILQENFAKVIEKCHRNITEIHPDVCLHKPDLCDLTCCQSLNLELIVRKSCICRACLHHVVNSILDMKLFECEKTLDLVLKAFSLKELKLHDNCHEIEDTFPVKFGSYRRLSFKCQDKSTRDPNALLSNDITEIETSELKDDHILMMVQSAEKESCHRLKYALNYSELNFPDFPTSGNSSWQSNFTGLGCQTNRTLLFIAMDVVLFHAFAENLGIDVLKNYHQSGVIITEAPQETQYVLHGHVNKRSLVEFIQNYTNGTLSRYLRTPVRKLNRCPHLEGNSICVEEVTTATFNKVVLDVEKDIVLLYYSSWCGACSAIAHIFLAASDHFRNAKGIKFARINGDENDLPWEFTVDKYPTIIFFPAKRKSASVVFPSNLEITGVNLLHFVLVHAQPKIRLAVAMEMCNRECIARNLIQSSKELRLLFQERRSLISDVLYAQEVISALRSGKSQSLKKHKTSSFLYSTPKGLNQYVKHLVNRIQKNRHKINQALHLKRVLIEKRQRYLDEALREKQKSGKYRDQRFNTGTFSKVTSKEKKSKFTVIRKNGVKDEL